MGTERRITEYVEFWPFYLQEHSRKATRQWHFLGAPSCKWNVPFLLRGIILPGLVHTSV